MPFSRSHSTALSISPSEAVSAFLQSIMPTPVISRRFFTSAAVKAILNSSKQFWYIRANAGADYSASAAASSEAASAVCSPCLPSSTALAMMEEISLMARMASSLPGIT